LNFKREVFIKTSLLIKKYICKITYKTISIILTIVQWVLPLALILPSWVVFVRRLHDTGYNEWWTLLIRASNIFCFIGLIIEIIFACLQSVPEENEYGPVPEE
jgi:uncharacterized membrane protein YhaH (DUF805 family)